MLRSEHWGVLPILFYINHHPIPSYSFFVALALLMGISVLVIEAYRNDRFNAKTWIILCAALIFGCLGAKLPIWLGHFHEIFSSPFNLNLFLSGRTIIGALIGGTLGVLLTKHLLKIDLKLGCEIAPALALGMAVGRIGCFLRGCCYGIPTNANWGVDFGDGIQRYPTQIVESVFGILLFIILLRVKKSVREPDRFFFFFVAAYLIFRFFIEFFRYGPYRFAGFSVFQWVNLIALLVISRQLMGGLFKTKQTND